MVFFGILWRFALKRYSSVSFLEAHISSCTAIPLPVHVRPPRWKRLAECQTCLLSVWRSQKHKRRTDHRRMGNSTPANSRSRSCSPRIQDGDEKIPPFLGKQKSKLL